MLDPQSETVDLLRAIERNTRDIADLLEVGYGAQLRRRLAPILSDQRKRNAYQATDGDASSRDVGRVAGVSDKTIRDWWRDWSKAGLLRPADTEGRFIKKYDLQRLALGEEDSS